MQKIIRVLVALAAACGLGALATGAAFASAASSRVPRHGQLASRGAYQQPQARVRPRSGGGDQPPQTLTKPSNNDNKPPQSIVA
jgi:hypothetical protein